MKACDFPRTRVSAPNAPSIDASPTAAPIGLQPRRTTKSPHTCQPFRFLDLPAELRDEIYELSWASHSSPPSSQSHWRSSEEGQRPFFQILIESCAPSTTKAKVTWHPHHHSGSKASPLDLLLVNKQISLEAARVLYSGHRLVIVYPRPTDTAILSRSIAAACPWAQYHTRHISIEGSFDAAENQKLVSVLLTFEKLQTLEVRYEMGYCLPHQIAVEMESFMSLVHRNVGVAFKGERIPWLREPDAALATDMIEAGWLPRTGEWFFEINKAVLIGMILVLLVFTNHAWDLLDEFIFIWDF